MAASTILWFASASLSGTNTFLSLPAVPSLTGSNIAQGGKSRFKVYDLDRFSYHYYITGSNLTGTLAVQVSNNMAGWVGYTGLSSSFNAASVSVDGFFAVVQNTAGYARLMFSGTSVGSGSITVSLAYHGATRG